MLIVVGLLLVLLLTAATGYFVALEFAFVAVDRGQLRRAARDGDRRAVRALTVVGRLSFMLSGAQLGITVTALLVGYVAEPFLGEGLAAVLGVAGVPEAVSLATAVALALILSTVIQMVLGELAPKNLAIARPLSLVRTLAGSALVYLTVAGPLIRVFDAAANRLLRRVGVEPVEELESGATAEDLEQILAESHAGGHLDPQLSTLLERGLGFQHRTAGEAMTPRVNVVAIRADEPCPRLVELLATGHTRFPVLGSGGVDDVVGVVSLAELLTVPVADRPSTALGSIAVEPLLVPNGLPLRHVLERLREQRRQMACVVDEYGGFAGVITLEDVAEELVGPIQDEDDLPEPVPERQADGSWLVPAHWRVDEISSATGLALPEADGYDTLSGLLLTVLGRVPVPGDDVELPAVGPHRRERSVVARVVTVKRHVPATVALVARGPSR